MPHSKLKGHIADILKAQGYISEWSKPGLRVYAKSTEIPTVLGGLGVAILSTSSGLLTDRQAEKKGVGGEVLAYVW
jgi:small subunit ribosomal protein S8